MIFLRAKEKKGITLIALVITIIVLLILAGVTIAALSGDNGILQNAARAKEETEKAEEDELIKLTITEAATHLEEYEYEDSNGEKITIPAQCAVSKLEGENMLEKGLVIIDINGNSWVWIEVPKNTTVYPNAGVNVTDFSNEECTKIYNDLKAYTINYKTGFEEDSYYSECGIDSEKTYNDLKNSMIKSIYQNEGFWIGQYEVGSFDAPVNSNDNKGRNAVIQEGAYPYYWVTCKQAQELSEGLAVGGKTSSLMFGIQWDLVLKYLEAKGISESELKTNSSSWGNYKDVEFPVEEGNKYVNASNGVLEEWNDIPANYKKPIFKDVNGVLLSTGATERNSKMNIYDLAGNEWEWTLEKSTDPDLPCVIRGGGLDFNGSDRPASSRIYYSISSDDGIAFRPVLW